MISAIEDSSDRLIDWKIAGMYPIQFPLIMASRGGFRLATVKFRLNDRYNVFK